jgi:hypothetical protein
MIYDIVKSVIKGASIGLIATGILMSHVAGMIYCDVKDAVKKDEKEEEIIEV